VSDAARTQKPDMAQRYTARPDPDASAGDTSDPAGAVSGLANVRGPGRRPLSAPDMVGLDPAMSA